MKPNLFDIATKELSQDGFFTWLFQWGDISNKNIEPNLHKVAKTLIKVLINKQIRNYDKSINKVCVWRQWEHIDISVKVNDEIFIIIEDKTNTRQHSGQLKTYKTKAEEYCKKQNLKLVRIYLKTGSEAKFYFEDIKKEEGYSIVNRNELLKIFELYKNIKNNIFKEFVEHLRNIEDNENKFANIEIGNWDGPAWIGFYRFLENELRKEYKKIHWVYVPNKSGGFQCCVLNWEKWKKNEKEKYPVYMQIEEGNLCFKISTDPEEIGNIDIDRRQIRNEWSDILIASKDNKYEIIKPSKFGTGKYMTVAIIEKENWLGKKNEKIVKENVIKRLKDYLSFFNKCLKNVND